MMYEDEDDEEGLTNHSPRGEIRQGVRHLARDVVTLVELQAQLLQVDLRKWMRASLAPSLILAALAVVAALASLPVLLLSLAYYLEESADWTLASALLAAGGVGLGVAVLVGVIAWALFRRGRGAFTRFRGELEHNVTWLKQVLGSPVETAEHFTSQAAHRPPR